MRSEASGDDLCGVISSARPPCLTGAMRSEHLLDLAFEHELQPPNGGFAKSTTAAAQRTTFDESVTVRPRRNFAGMMNAQAHTLASTE